MNFPAGVFAGKRLKEKFIMRIKQAIVTIVGAVLLAPSMALAAPQCFQLFSGVTSALNNL